MSRSIIDQTRQDLQPFVLEIFFTVHFPEYTLDMDTAIESLKKLSQYNIEAVICYHSGLYKNDANQRIAELTL